MPICNNWHNSKGKIFSISPLSRCLVDSQLPGSRSHFLPRRQDDKLHLVIDAFKFHNEDAGEVRLHLK